MDLTSLYKNYLCAIPNLPDRRGLALTDFDALIDLIKSTIAPNSWDDVGGPGAVEAFEGGVHCDADGTLRRVLRNDSSGDLNTVRKQSRKLRASDTGAIAASTPLRKISLSRLEKHLERSLAEGRSPSDEMRNLAGLYRIRYVLVYPDQREIVLAGPAGAWREDAEGRRLNVESGQPVVQLDDLVTVFRATFDGDGGRFGCSITPTQHGLARTKSFIEESNKRPLKPGERGIWLSVDPKPVHSLDLGGRTARHKCSHEKRTATSLPN
jgi:hypothetical protein